MLLPLIVWIWTCEPEMPAVPIVAAVAIDAAATTAAATALTAITSATFAASLAGGIIAGAVGGAAGGAISGAAFGGDPGMDALTGAISGGIGGGVGSPESGVTQDIQSSLGVSPQIAQGLAQGGSSFAAGTLGGLATGQKFGQALKGGAVSGIGSGIASGLGSEFFGNQPPSDQTQVSIPGEQIITGSGNILPQDITPPPGFDPNRPVDFSNFNSSFSSPDIVNQSSSGQSRLSGAAQSALSYGIKTGLNDLLGPSPSGGSQSTTANFTTSPTFNATPTDVTLGGGSPSVAALAQALRTVPDLGYSPGGPVFGSDASKANRKVWNKASLRVTDDQNQ